MAMSLNFIINSKKMINPISISQRQRTINRHDGPKLFFPPLPKSQYQKSSWDWLPSLELPQNISIRIFILNHQIIKKPKIQPRFFPFLEKGKKCSMSNESFQQFCNNYYYNWTNTKQTIIL